MTRRTMIVLTLGLGLGACAAPGNVVPRVGRPAVTYTTAGLERVIGQDAAGLVRLFGQPDFVHRHWDVRARFGGDAAPGDRFVFAKGTFDDVPIVHSFDDSAVA